MLLVNSNGTVVDANAAAVRSLQAPGTSLVGRGVLSVLPDFDPSRIPGSMRPDGGAEDDTAVRMTALRTDGSELTVEVVAHEFEHDGIGFGLSAGGSAYDSYGSSYGRSSDRELLLITVRDLTARLEVEAELRRQHKQTEMILRAAAEGVVGVDNDGRVVLVNPAAAHLLGHRASELGGQELLPLVMHSRPDGTPMPPEESPLMDTLSSGRRHRVKNAALWRKDGRPVPVELATAPVRDGDQLVGAVMTFSDRSAFRALTERHRQLGALLELELRGPLDRLDETLEQLARDPAGQLWPEANWVLRRLADECRRTARLVDGVLAYQRLDEALERGTEQLDRRPVALDRVVDQAVRAATDLVGVGRVEFSVHPSPVELVVDEARLVDALAHLIADVAVADGGPTAAGQPGLYGMAVGVASGLASGGEADRTVVIAAAQRGEVARVEVRGPGQGGGVHLPIARGIVERHGGVLQAHELPGRQGVTYVVELPLDPEAAPVFRPPAPPRENATTLLPELPPELTGPAPQEPTDRQERGPGQDQTGGRGRSSAQVRSVRSAQSGSVQAGVVPVESAPALPAARRAPDEHLAAPTGAALEVRESGSNPTEGTDRSRRRNRLPEPEVIRPPRPAQEEPQDPDGTFPGLIGGPVYPGLEHALPPEGSAVVPERRPAGGRRRRLALGPASGDTPAEPLPTGAADLSPAALQPAEPMAPAPLVPPVPAPMTPISQSWPSAPAHAGTPDLHESASRESRESREARELRESSTRTNGRGVQVSRSRHAAVLPFNGAPDVPSAGGGNTGVMSLAQSPLQAVQTPPQGVALPSSLVPAAREESTGPRSLLVWPEPETATEQALRARGFGPVLVSSREEVEAQAHTRPAALFVDPLTGPITRSALQTLRSATGDYEVPMLVTAGLGLAAPEAVYGADPAVLLRALAPRDSERHAPRVLLVEQDPDIAAAFTASLERRGMQVEHTASENDAVSRASSVQPNLVVMDLMLIRRRRQGIIDWLRGSHRLFRTPLVVYTSVVDDREQRRGLSSGATMLFFAERSTNPEVQSRIVDLLGKIATATEA